MWRFFCCWYSLGMASKWDIDKSLNLAKVMGRDASEFFGPYANNDE